VLLGGDEALAIARPGLVDPDVPAPAQDRVAVRAVPDGPERTLRPMKTRGGHRAAPSPAGKAGPTRSCS